MAFRRRRPLIAVTIALFVLIYISLTHQGPSRWQFVPASNPTNGRDPTRFAWNNVVIQYPLKNLRLLGSGSPRKLPKVQHNFGPESEQDKAQRLTRRKAVQSAFIRCWTSYQQHAWLKDELKPVTGSFRTTFGGWAATLVDSLDTLAIMGMKPELNAAIHAATTIDFSTSLDEVINVFETNIRYLGGFLAAYDLTGDKRLLKKAIEVGEMLLVAFDTPNHMPMSRWHWQDAANGSSQVAPENMVVAELGSFTLEFTRLSQVTGDMRWYDAVARIMDAFDQQALSTNIPGLWPVGVDPSKLVLNEETRFSLGAMADSLYEYFPKQYALLGGQQALYRKLYENSMKPSIEHLFFKPMTPQNLDILVSGTAQAYSRDHVDLNPSMQHLSCFTGGMLALGGKLFDLPEHIDVGRKLTEGCIWAYNSSINGVMPEVADLVACTSVADCAWNETAWHEAVAEKNFVTANKDVTDVIETKAIPPGFSAIGDRSYLLRPEAIESVMILYRITGDKYFQDAAWAMFTAIQKLTETEFANAAVTDVTEPLDKIRRRDSMESFWLGETLKYFYLTFSDPQLISLDDYVFNTEAHPFIRPK